MENLFQWVLQAVAQVDLTRVQTKIALVVEMLQIFCISIGYDAEKALEAGCSAIYVSNHGGRQLDGVSSTVSVFSMKMKNEGRFNSR